MSKANVVELWEVRNATKGIGRTFPQIQDRIGGDWETYPWIRRWSLPSRPRFGTLLLARGARFTDVLSAIWLSSRGFIVSKRVVKLLEEFNLGKHRVYPVPVKASGERVLYYWVQMANNVTRRSDFTRSILGEETGPYDRKRVVPLRFASLAKLRSHGRPQPGLHSVVPNQAVLRGKQRSYPDLLTFDFDVRVYASTRLKERLTSGAVTGLEFLPSRIRFLE